MHAALEAVLEDPLAAAAGVDLGLDHQVFDGQPLGGVIGFLGCGGDFSLGAGHAESVEKFLGLVFVDVHGCGESVMGTRAGISAPQPISQPRTRSRLLGKKTHAMNAANAPGDLGVSSSVGAVNDLVVEDYNRPWPCAARAAEALTRLRVEAIRGGEFGQAQVHAVAPVVVLMAGTLMRSASGSGWRRSSSMASRSCSGKTAHIAGDWRCWWMMRVASSA